MTTHAPKNNGLTSEERQAYVTNCQGCQNPVTACVCANGPTLPQPATSAEQHPQDPIYDYQDPKPSTCPNCGRPMPITHALTMAPGIVL
jgi:hypothetical protein